MNDQPDDDQKEEPVEGVRLVSDAEAKAALESGAAISRNSLPNQGRLISLVGYESDDPEPTWADTDEASSSMRILGTAERVSAQLRMPGSSSTTASTSVTIEDDFDLDLRASNTPDDEPAVEAEPGIPDRGISRPPVSSGDDRINVTPVTGETQLPHWTEAPSGEVPAFGGGDNPGESEPTEQWSLDDLSQASRLGAEDDDALEAAFAALGEVPAVDPNVQAPSGSPTEPDQGVQQESVGGAQGQNHERANPMEAIEEKVESLKKASIVTRSATAVVAAVLAIAAFAAGPAWAMLLSLLVVMLCAIEYFDALRRVGYRPATALGLVAVAGAVLGTYARGEAAIPLVLVLTAAFTFLWYMTGVIRDNPTANISVTLLGVVWTGIFGSYAALILKAPNHEGLAFLGAAVILVIAYDTFAYLGGVLLGKHKLIPSISPGKTWEGLAVATAASITLGLLVVPQIHPWGYGDGLVLGIVIAAVAPLGDLAESMIKRDLGLKDMGRLLPGHGGVLDRFDALLFVLPATYYVCRMLNLI